MPLCRDDLTVRCDQDRALLQHLLQDLLEVLDVDTWEKQAHSASRVQARRKALRIRYINGMEVRKKRSRGFKKRPRGVE